MSRSLDDTRAWVATGTELCRSAIAGLDEASYDAPTLLADWTRRHLVAHLAANADAIGNLVHWATTGDRAPMYTSPNQRNADIEAGARKSGAELGEWFNRSAARLAEAMDTLTDEQWRAEVVTAQGRTVPASETPWMRAREVLVHAVDLDAGTAFADLPDGFLEALAVDITAKRVSTSGHPSLDPLPEGSRPEQVA